MSVPVSKKLKVIVMSSAGASQREIARTLGISRETVAIVLSDGIIGKRDEWTSRDECLMCGGPLPCEECARERLRQETAAGRRRVEKYYGTKDLMPALPEDAMKRKIALDAWKRKNPNGDIQKYVEEHG